MKRAPSHSPNQPPHLPPYLLIDAGNSRIKWALADAAGVLAHAGAASHDSLQDGAQPLPGWSNLPAPASAWISNVAGDTVAQRLDALIEAQWPGLPRTVIRARAQQCGVTNDYTTPDALGSDRWAGMIGARAAFPDEPLLIATLGTATTLEALRGDGTFVGGLIAPGWSLMMRSLGEHTAQLPVLNVLDARAAGGPMGGESSGENSGDSSGDGSGGAEDAHHALPFATDTKRSIAAGCALAQAALIERAWADLEHAWHTPVRLVVSGGAAAVVTAALKVPHTRHDALVLAGLALIAAQA
ncbi:MAG: type III pantothenate kinase [Paraburkholderia sp.]|uniref:type III pantothenate kinase n=1 Tax=Paraburkholderia sp. TaxID=1926495 RepID=UPI00120DB8CE|nr:type III pantothenate kinase [Paraburkholderia sp.]TAM00838.1 MAG: type III pantothenate kinase [Paraburkholderia sp.]TAM30552.1 MAG: type III pantothenate kinase [Paraburkholderia sp.]